MTLKDEIFNRIENGRCEVLGLGISNLPLCRWLIEKGAEVVGRDMKKAEEITAASELSNLGVTLVTGEDYLADIGGDIPEKTVIFRAPGMRPDMEQIANAVKKGALLTSEMELFLELTPATVLGITGSDGKTTTTTLVGKILEEEFSGTDRRVYVGGNIGQPLLPIVEEMKASDFAVVELSSFQLMTVKKSPSRAIITNITPNHLNWHTDMEEYDTAKRNVYSFAPCEKVILNAENERTAKAGAEAKIPVAYFSSKRELAGETAFLRDGAIIYSDGEREEKVLDTESIAIPGMHNVENYMAAILLTRPFVSVKSVRKVAESFAGVEHRCEFFCERGGVRYYNSSIDSTPTRTAAALSNFKTKPIVICGGRDKNTDFAPLAKTLCDKAKAVVLTGEAMGKIKTALLEYPEFEGSGLAVAEEPDFEKAALLASKMAKTGDLVILSPACTSFDAFKNFEERGKKFKEIIKNI